LNVSMNDDRDLGLPTVEALAAVFALESVKGFGPQKFREVHDAGLTASDVLTTSSRLTIKGKRGEAFRAEIQKLDGEAQDKARARAERQLERAREHGARILLHGDPRYPANVWASNNPVPVLYVLGDVGHLADQRALACVGSREIGGEYADRQSEFVGFAARQGWAVVSGFALGADTIAHQAARDAGGRTVCVMPCGLDRPFPPENKGLWKEFQGYPGAVMVSEFPFGTAAAALTLRKRNKLIVAAALGPTSAAEVANAARKEWAEYGRGSRPAPRTARWTSQLEDAAERRPGPTLPWRLTGRNSGPDQMAAASNQVRALSEGRGFRPRSSGPGGGGRCIQR
jgi:hypothetical protein